MAVLAVLPVCLALGEALSETQDIELAWKLLCQRYPAMSQQQRDNTAPYKTQYYPYDDMPFYQGQHT